MDSASEDGRSRITLEFSVTMDMDKALLLVANRLDRVSGYPAEASEPELRTSGSEDNSIAWMVLRPKPGHERPVHTFGEFAEDVVRERLERVPGVGRVDVYGGSRRELRAEIDPFRLARFRLTVSEVLARLRAADASISAGEVGGRQAALRGPHRGSGRVGRRRPQGPPSNRAGPGGPGRVSRLTVGDVADVRFAYREPRARIRHLGAPSLAVSVKREIGANVIETMAGLRPPPRSFRRAPSSGPGSPSARSTTRPCTSTPPSTSCSRTSTSAGCSRPSCSSCSSAHGGRPPPWCSRSRSPSSARSWRWPPSGAPSTSSPSPGSPSRSNGGRRRDRRPREHLSAPGGSVPAREAARRGASEVWGAVLVSALTTVMVFIPILVLKLEVAQLSPGTSRSRSRWRSCCRCSWRSP